jgi:DNA-binding LacI/PurR family transcriptional regulator
MRFFQKNGIRVPDDIALVGFSNLDLTDLLSPALSVVRQPAYEIGQVATELLIEQIESKRPVLDFETRILQPQLFVRASSSQKIS